MSDQNRFLTYDQDLDISAIFSSVLLIEDEPAHARLIIRALEGVVGEVIHVSTGHEALQELESHLFELVLSDLHLPDMSGIELLKQIRNVRPDLPTIVMTSSSSLEDAVGAMREGAWDYMVKHFSEDLSERVRLVVTRAADRKMRQMRELQLRAERDAFWAAVRTAQDGMAILGSSGVVVFSNERFDEFRSLILEGRSSPSSSSIVDLVSLCDSGVAKALKAHIDGPGGENLWSSELKVALSAGGKSTGRSSVAAERHFELIISSAKLVGLSEVGDGATSLSEFRRSVLWVKDITRRKEQEKFQRDLLSTTTHDLKGPLGAILTSAELLGSVLTNPDKRVQDLLPRIASCARNSINLIDELLSARRIQDGVLVVKPHWYDLADLFEDVLLDYLPLARAKRIQFFSRAFARPVEVYADKLGLHRVLGNLVSNAIKFTAEGGKVELWAEEARGEVRIGVSDSGSGIDAANRAKLFERYSRLEQHQGVEGTGLGLYVTKNIVDAHGGRIEIASELGVGTTFTVCLPSPPR